MKIVSKSEATTFTNGPTCEGAEYSFGDTAMNLARVTVSGRYPESGYVMNEVCHEVGYVVSGTGKVCQKGGDEQLVGPGDAVYIAPGEAYFWEGDALTMLMPCAPAFYPEQHKKVA